MFMTFRLADRVSPTALQTLLARWSETPFISYYSPEEMLDIAHAAGFSSARHISPADLTTRYFTRRIDGLRLPSAEHLLLARVSA
jgi:hypothetical protein